MRAACLAGLLCLATASGCAFLPEITHQPSVHNPFPQLSRVAVAPFFNLSTEPTLDGRAVALAYFAELQAVPGFEVVPVGVVETTLEAYQLSLDSPADARKLAQLLGVDAVVVGAVTDFSPYYPPRVALQVEWYAANPGYHPIPPGYGLPWGTTEEEQIPDRLIFEAELALARAQLKTQTPDYVPPAHEMPKLEGEELPAPREGETEDDKNDVSAEGEGQVLAHAAPLGPTGLPPDWPDPRGFAPPPPSPMRPELRENLEPVLRHTKTYHGHDGDVTEALRTYVYFRDDARFGGWQAYLQRSDDYLRFCCYLHISEMLTARGGAGQSRVVYRWPVSR